MDWKQLILDGAEIIDRTVAEYYDLCAEWLKQAFTPVPLEPDDPLTRASYDMPNRPKRKPKPPVKPPQPPPEPVTVHAPRATGKTLPVVNIHSIPVTLPQWVMLVDAEADGMAIIGDSVSNSDANKLAARGYGVIHPAEGGVAHFELTELGLAYMDSVPLARQPDSVPLAPASREVEGWQPILTAPTHTRVILFGYNEDETREVAMCFREDTGEDDWVYSPQGGRIVFKPMLWRPVPAIPED